MTSELRGVSSAERTLDARELAALRPARESTPRPRKPRREPMDRSLTFFCSNPQCDHATWAPIEQARHMAREFWEVAQALVRLAPESAEALKLTGGVVLRDLTDEECREAHATYRRYKYHGADLNELPLEVALRRREYDRRAEAGILSSAPPRKLHDVCKHGHLLAEENTYVGPTGKRSCRECRRERGRARRATAEDREYRAQRFRERYREDPEFRERVLQKNRRRGAAS